MNTEALNNCKAWAEVLVGDFVAYEFPQGNFMKGKVVEVLPCENENLLQMMVQFDTIRKQTVKVIPTSHISQNYLWSPTSVGHNEIWYSTPEVAVAVIQDRIENMNAIIENLRK